MLIAVVVTVILVVAVTVLVVVAKVVAVAVVVAVVIEVVAVIVVAVVVVSIPLVFRSIATTGVGCLWSKRIDRDRSEVMDDGWYGGGGWVLEGFDGVIWDEEGEDEDRFPEALAVAEGVAIGVSEAVVAAMVVSLLLTLLLRKLLRISFGAAIDDDDDATVAANAWTIIEDVYF